MLLRKMLLLAGTALAAIAFAVPAAAQAEAPEWLTEPGGATLLGEAQLHMAGELSWKSGALTSGPCAVTFEGVAKNEKEMAAGQLESGESLSHPCPTNLPGCTVTPDFANFNWAITGVTVTGELGLEIRSVTSTATYPAFCQSTYGLPKEVSTTGTATGLVEANEECISFEGHQDDLFIEVGGQHTGNKVDLEGVLCIEGLSLP